MRVSSALLMCQSEGLGGLIPAAPSAGTALCASVQSTHMLCFICHLHRAVTAVLWLLHLCWPLAPVVKESCASAGQRAPWQPASTQNKCSVLSPALFTCLRPTCTAQFGSVRFHLELPQNRICIWSACPEWCLSHAEPWKWQMLPGKVLAGSVFLI